MPICVKCGKVGDSIKGSYKHPYCPDCYDKEFSSDEEYYKYLNKTHIYI